MKWRVLTSSLAIVLLFIVCNVSALDNPHNISKTVNCADCHISSPNAIWWTDQGGEQGASRGICRSCHTSGGLGPYVMTHSSAAVSSTKYGTWDNKCTVCHNPHTQRQFRTYKAASYVYTGISTAVTADSLTRAGAGWTADQWEGYILLPNVQYMNQHYRILTNTAEKITIDTGNGGIDTISLTYVRPGNTFAIVYDGLIKEAVGGRAVRFFNTTGSKSFADGDVTYDGICEVCHTRTQGAGGLARYRNTAHDDSHYEMQTCTACHPHGSGFRPSCNACHEYPPRTNAHLLHVETLRYVCDDCHFGNTHNPSNISTTPSQFLNDYNRNLVDIGFDPGGFNSDATNGVNLGPPSFAQNASPDLAACANLTCHNPDNAITGKGNGTTSKSDNRPVWGGTINTCSGASGCHVNATSSAPDGGSHYSHQYPNSSYGYAVDCTACHSGINIADPEISGTDPRHANKSLEIDQNNNYPINVLASLPARTGITADYADGAPGTTAGGRCANVYCHGSSDLSNGAGLNITRTWGSNSINTCDSCHRNYNLWPYAPNRSHGVHIDTDFGGRVYNYGPSNDQSGCACHENWGTGIHADGKPDIRLSSDGRLANTAVCDNCHGTAEGIAEAKANWFTNTTTSPKRISDCVYCHNSVTPANARIDGSGETAPAMMNFLSTGHGKTGIFSATNNSGPGYGCQVCHDDNSLHFSFLPGQKYTRMKTVPGDGLAYTTPGSELCLDCHKVGKTGPGALGHDAAAEASVHSGAVTDRYNTNAAAAYPYYGDRNSYSSSPGYQCSVCHDPHGTPKLAMIKPSINSRIGGITNTVAVPGLESSDTDLRDLDPTPDPDNGVCDACHATSGSSHPDTAHPNNHNQGNSGDACKACHDHRYSFVHRGPHISVSDPVSPAGDLSIPFGSRVVTTAGNMTVTVANKGTENLVIGTIAGAGNNPLSAPFSIANDTCSGSSVAPMGSCTFDVRFAPSATGAFSDDFGIPSNDSALPLVTFSVSGSGTAPGPDITVSGAFVLPKTLQGATSMLTVTVKNDGTQALEIYGIAGSDPLAAPFFIQNNTCSGQTLAPSGTCTFDLRFSPAAGGSFSDTFDIPSNDPDEASVSVSVQGEGEAVNYAYLAHTYGDISRIRVNDHAKLSQIAVGVFERVRGLGVTPDGTMVYATHYNVNTTQYFLSKYRTSDLGLEKRVSFGASPYLGVYMARSGLHYYMTYQGSGAIYVRDTANDTAVKSIAIGSNPYHMEESHDGSRLYIPVNGANTVSVVNVSSANPADWAKITDVPVGTGPVVAAVTPDDQFVYVTNGGSHTVSVIATASNTVVSTIPVGNTPKGLAVTPDGKYVYVANYVSNSVSVISTASNTVVETFSVSAMPQSVDISADGSYVYVVTYDGKVSIINTLYNTVQSTLALDDSYVQNFNSFMTNE